MKFAALVCLLIALFGLSLGLKHGKQKLDWFQERILFLTFFTDVCGQTPGAQGFCLAGFTKFAYHAERNLCEKFIYGGCDGNANRFDTLEECEFVCKEKDYWNVEFSNSVSYVK